MSELAPEQVRRRPTGPVSGPAPAPGVQAAPRTQALPLPPGMAGGAWQRGRGGVDMTPGGSVVQRTAQLQRAAQQAAPAQPAVPAVARAAGRHEIRRLTMNFAAPPGTGAPVRQEVPNVPSGTLSRQVGQLRGQGLSSDTVRGIAPRKGEAGALPAPPLPAATRVAGGGISEGRQLAAQLAREPRAAPKEMVDTAKYFSGADLATKDTREGWQAYRERTAAVEKDLLKTADDPELLETKAEQYERQLLEGAQNERGNFIVALPGMLLNRTEVKVQGPWTAEGARNPRQGRLQWAVPHDELDASRENEPGGGMRKQTPTTEHMSTAFGGSTGEGIFVFAQGRLFVGDAEKIMQDMNVATTSGASVNSLKFSAYHSSFLGGQPVEAAGEIGVDADGRLVSVSNLSGHYRPEPEHLINVLKFFAGRGVDISSVAVKIPGKSYTAAEFIKAHGIDARQ